MPIDDLHDHAISIASVRVWLHIVTHAVRYMRGESKNLAVMRLHDPLMIPWLWVRLRPALNHVTGQEHVR